MNKVSLNTFPNKYLEIACLKNYIKCRKEKATRVFMNYSLQSWKTLQKKYKPNLFILNCNYERLSQQKFQINRNITNNKNYEFFIDLHNELLSSSDKYIRKLAIKNTNPITRMLEFENSQTLYDSLVSEVNEIEVENEKEVITDINTKTITSSTSPSTSTSKYQFSEIKMKNIDYLKIRKLDTITKYERIIDLLKK